MVGSLTVPGDFAVLRHQVISGRLPQYMSRDEAEGRLLHIWRDVLQIANVRSDANFFELSGSSLQAVDLVRRVGAELGREVTVLDLLDCPSFTEFAGCVRAAPALSRIPGTGTGTGTGAPTTGVAAVSLRRPSLLQEASLRVDGT